MSSTEMDRLNIIQRTVLLKKENTDVTIRRNGATDIRRNGATLTWPISGLERGGRMRDFRRFGNRLCGGFFMSAGASEARQ
jgi:hypothetical protein